MTRHPEGNPMHPTVHTVLVTGAGGPAGSTAVHQLLDRGLRVIATDITPVPYPSEDFVLGPYAASPSYVPFLEETVARRGVDLIVPTVQDELPSLAAAAPILGCQVAIGSPGPVSLCHDKLLTMRFLGSRGVAVPSTAVVRPSGVSPTRVRECPFVVKPRISRGSRGVVVVDGPEQVPTRNDTYIAQDLAPGREYCPQVHRSAADGTTTVVVLRKPSLRPGHIGYREAVERVDLQGEPQIAELAAEVAQALDLTGAMDMDVRLTRSGVPVVLEVNARLGAHSHHAPEMLERVLADAAGPDSTPGPDSAAGSDSTARPRVTATPEGVA